MVAIEEIEQDEGQAIPLSEERRLDAQAIEEAASKMTRVSAKMRLEELAKKLRKESEALARVEKSQKAMETNDEQPTAAPASAAPQQEPPSAAPVAAAPAPASPTSVAASPPTTGPSAKYTPIDKFAFDDGGYNGAFVTLYIDLPGVGAIPRENVKCNFTKESFDLIVQELDGKSYRLVKNNLEKDINPDKSKIVVKAQKVLVKLAKVKGEYGYDHWSKLTDNKKKEKAGKASDPQSSIMDMMKNMYDEGDDQMKKMIGETMMKQRRGELGDGMGGMGAGMPGMDDLYGGM